MIETENLPEFTDSGKIYRISRDCIITLKIDGAQNSVLIDDNDKLFTASRNKWITPKDDSFGFSNWVQSNEEEIRKLGKGRHFGEFACGKIQRGYGIKEKRFYLFNVSRWIQKEEDRWNDKQEVCPSCCRVVPILYRGLFSTDKVDFELEYLNLHGHEEFPDWPGNKHEGIVVFMCQSGYLFKKTTNGDGHKN